MPPPAQLRPEFTADRIIRFFRELGIVVCADQALIKRKVDGEPGKPGFRTQVIRWEGSTNPQHNIKAAEWRQVHTVVRDQMDAVLDRVYEQFGANARVAGKNHTVVTQAFLDSLADMVRDICLWNEPNLEKPARCDLNVRWRDRIQQEENWIVDELIHPKAEVEDFKAKSGENIELSWEKLPPQCKNIEIEQTDEATGKTTAYKPDKPSKTSWTEKPAPGKWYSYRARVVESDGPGAWCQPQRAIRTSPPELSHELKTGGILLSWATKPANIPVTIFKAEGRDPRTVMSGGFLSATQGTEELVPDKKKPTELLDSDVVEGNTYHYMAVAYFGEELFVPSKVIKVTIPKPPPPPKFKKAVVAFSGDKPVVNLSWEKPRGVASALSYTLVRGEGGYDPNRYNDDQCWIKPRIGGTTFPDGNGLAVGKRYRYRFFSCQGDLHSRESADSGYVDIIKDVDNLKTGTIYNEKTDSGAVTLSWECPPNLDRIVILRKTNEPASGPHDAAAKRVPLQTPASAHDADLVCGREYNYTVWCVFKPDGHAEVFSKGIAHRVVVVPPPPPPPDTFEAQQVGEEVHCTWSEPAYGSVEILRTASPPAYTCGAIGDSADLDKLKGKRIPVSHCTAIDNLPDFSEPYYSLFTTVDSSVKVRYGSTRLCPVITEVSDLKGRQTQAGVELKWHWPSGCTAVAVVRRDDGEWPAGADDPHAKRKECSKDEYEKAGHRFPDRITLDKADFRYIVYARATGLAGTFHSQGKADGCRLEFSWIRWMTLRYDLRAPGKLGSRRKHLVLNWELVDNPRPDFSGFALLANEQGIPTDLGQDREIFRWEPKPDQALHAGMRFSKNIPLDRLRGWNRVFFKLRILDPLQEKFTLVIHPDTARNRDARTGRDAERAALPRHILYRKGMPSKITCPVDFCEFAVEDMLFAAHPDPERDQGGDIEPIKARYSSWRTFLNRKMFRNGEAPSWLRGRLKIPEHKGVRLTRKLCPECRHELPLNAGLQSSLTIGLIGAAQSGKTHYVASLVHALRGRAGDESGTSLMPVTQDTADRYEREFGNPLFEQKRQLQANVAGESPPPLIYDLQFDQRERRGVTLSLYDTAGENLKNPVVARHTVRYIGIASGLVFLVDPLQIPAVRQRVPESILPKLRPEATPDKIVDTVWDLLQEHQMVAQGASIDIPVAIVLSKCDVLRDQGLIGSNRLWCTDERHIGGFDKTKHDDMAGMIAECIRDWDMQAYNMITKRLPNHAFFGVSATGCCAKSDRYAHVAPMRVEDPIWWMLDCLEVMPKRKD